MCASLYWIFNEFRNCKFVQRKMLPVQKRKNALESNERFPVTIGIDKAVETLGMKKM